MKKIAVVVSGCGHQDGAELTETISLLVSLSEMNASYQVFALNEEFPIQNHQTHQPVAGEKRNSLIESGRISRGTSKNLNELDAKDFDGLALPGGYGAAKNLSSWATENIKYKVHPLIEKVILDFHSQSKPIAAICVAPVLVAKVLAAYKPVLTLGQNPEVAAAIEKVGAQHESCPTRDFITDRFTKVITTPAYMDDNATPFDVYTGIRGLTKELVEMA